LPLAGGIGTGIDRLCLMLLGQRSIRDVILFPQLKPKLRRTGVAPVSDFSPKSRSSGT